MTINFAIGTIIVVLAIFVIFFIAAQRADKIVAEKAAAKRAEMEKSGPKTKKNLRGV